MLIHTTPTNRTARSRLKMMAAAAPLALVIAGLHPASALAQTAEPDTGKATAVPEVIVTAQRREESMQKSPVAVSAFSSASLTKAGVFDVLDLQKLVPSLVIGGNNQQGETPIAIRGISGSTAGIGSENPVAVYINGVYIGASSGAVFEFGDIDHLEVLRGPQGTLYGRNATGGAISVFTRQPTPDPAGEIVASYGSFNTAHLTGWYSGPIADKVQLEVSGFYARTDGWETNLYNGEKVNGTQDYGLRGAVKFVPNANLDFTVAADWGHQEDPAAFHSNSPGPFSWNTVNVNDPVRSDRDLGGVSGTLHDNLGFATLTSISAYRTVDTNYDSDSDSLPTEVYQSPIFITEDQVSQELRLASNDTGPFTWIAGLFYFNSFSTFNYSPLHLGSVYAADSATATTNSYAGYAQADYHPIKPLTLTVGLRYTVDDKQYFLVNRFPNVHGVDTIPPTNEHATFPAFTPRFAANYQVTDDVMVYASATRGFRAGGFNLTASSPAFAPEYVWSYEAGIKTDLFDHKVRLNLTGFHYVYDNLQVRQLPAPGVSIVLNAASAKVDGVETEFEWIPFAGLRFSADGSYLDAQYQKFSESGTNLAGNYLNRAPKLSGSLTGDYSFNISNAGLADASVTYSGQSKEFFNEFNVPLLEGKGYADVDARLAFTPSGTDGLTFSLVGKNLTDERHLTNGLQLASIYYDVTVNEPRSFMVEVRKRF